MLLLALSLRLVERRLDDGIVRFLPGIAGGGAYGAWGLSLLLQDSIA